MKRIALVVFDSRWGNTGRIAEALARGLRRVGGIEAACRNVAQVGSDEIERASLIAIGGPTEYFSESSHLKAFFERFGGFDYHGKYGFAFDTHVNSPLSGGAAGWIERHMRALGFYQLRPHRSAFTVPTPAVSPGTWAGPGQIELAPGMEQEFETLGIELGHLFLRFVTALPTPGRLRTPPRIESKSPPPPETPQTG